MGSLGEAQCTKLACLFWEKYVFVEFVNPVLLQSDWTDSNWLHLWCFLNDLWILIRNGWPKRERRHFLAQSFFVLDVNGFDLITACMGRNLMDGAFIGRRFSRVYLRGKEKKQPAWVQTTPCCYNGGCLYVCLHVLLCVCLHMCLCVCLYVYLCVLLCASLCACMCVCLDVCLRVPLCVCLCMCACMFFSGCVCLCVVLWVCLCLYVCLYGNSEYTTLLVRVRLPVAMDSGPTGPKAQQYKYFLTSFCDADVVACGHWAPSEESQRTNENQQWKFVIYHWPLPAGHTSLCSLSFCKPYIPQRMCIRAPALQRSYESKQTN